MPVHNWPAVLSAYSCLGEINRSTVDLSSAVGNQQAWQLLVDPHQPAKLTGWFSLIIQESTG